MLLYKLEVEDKLNMALWCTRMSDSGGISPEESDREQTEMAWTLINSCILLLKLTVRFSIYIRSLTYYPLL